MPSLTNNSLMLVSILALVFYWTAGLYVSEPYISGTVSTFLMLTGASVLWRYGRATFDVVVRGERNDDDEGHLAVYGAFLLSVGALYSGGFNIVWVYSGQPAEWLGTAQSNFGRALMAGGFALLFRSPEALRKKLMAPSTVWLAVFAFIAVAVAFFLGAQVGNVTATGFSTSVTFAVPNDRPICPDDRPVWVASGGRVYHTEESAYRALVVPSRCYRTPGDAERAGFRAAN